MPLSSHRYLRAAASICLVVLIRISGADAAMDPRFELDSKTLASVAPVTGPASTNVKRTASSRTEKSSSEGEGSTYTVKPGDHLFKILMRDYGLSNSEAESFIEEIKRENNIYDIKRLKVGRKITIPPVRRSSDGSLRLMQPMQASTRRPSGSEGLSGQSFRLESPVAPLSEQEFIGKIRETWDKIIPAKTDLQKPLAFHTQTFSLTLDPQRFPTFAAQDGGRILLDQGGSIPPLVKSLIEAKEPGIRIVSETQVGSKRFLASMLEAAGFYSVEENFSMDFGVDPKLTTHADFKVEKNSESLIKQDVILMNSGRGAVPPVLVDFLKKEGFSLYEPFASLRSYPVRNQRLIHQIISKKQPEILDGILGAFSVVPDRDRRLDVFASDNNGISLAVKAERYFERGGQRYIVTRFDGDPINYTLFRILETKGIRVIFVEPQDDFRKLSEKIISRMKISGTYTQHNLLQDGAANYSLQMSGFKLDDPTLPGGGVFLTNLAMDKIVRELLTENGYSITSK